MEVSPEALGTVRDDVAATRDAIRDDLGPLLWRMRNLNVPSGAMHDVLTVADRLDTDVLPTLDWHVARARDLATLRYGGSMGAVLPVVDVDDGPLTPAPHPFTHTPWDDGSTALSWPAAPLEDQGVDRRDTASSDPISAWFEGHFDDLAAAVEDGAGWLAQHAVDAWEEALQTGTQVGDWWERTSADLGSWVDENLGDVRELIGQHVAIFRFLADACRIVGWVVVAFGVVLTVALAVIGAMGGSALGALFGLGVGAVPGGGAGAIVGASVGLKVLGAGFTLLAVGDFLDVAADWGEGTIDGQDLVQQGGLELALAIGSLVGFGAVGKLLQKTYHHLPDAWVKSSDEWLTNDIRPPDPPNRYANYADYAGKPGFLVDGAIDPRAFSTTRSSAFFWSGRTSAGAGVEGAARRAASASHGTTLEQLMEQRGIELPEWDPDDAGVQQMWADASAAFAEGVSGEVRAVVGSSLRPGNVWQTVELPRLMVNPEVTRIVEIDPETGLEKQVYP